MQVKYKLWLDFNGRVFGDGPAKLLDRVVRTNSLRKAASEMGMSYNKAWRILNAAEQRLGFSLLDRAAGGSYGGGSRLTEKGRDLAERYKAFQADADVALMEVFERHFSDWVDIENDV